MIKHTEEFKREAVRIIEAQYKRDAKVAVDGRRHDSYVLAALARVQSDQLDQWLRSLQIDPPPIEPVIMI